MLCGAKAHRVAHPVAPRGAAPPATPHAAACGASQRRTAVLLGVVGALGCRRTARAAGSRLRQNSDLIQVRRRDMEELHLATEWYPYLLVHLGWFTGVTTSYGRYMTLVKWLINQLVRGIPLYTKLRLSFAMVETQQLRRQLQTQ